MAECSGDVQGVAALKRLVCVVVHTGSWGTCAIAQTRAGSGPRIAATKPSSLVEIQVETDRVGMVTKIGTVSEAAAEYKAVPIAKSFKGISSVDSWARAQTAVTQEGKLP